MAEAPNPPGGWLPPQPPGFSAPTPPRGQASPPSGPPRFVRDSHPRPASGLATASLVMGIAGLTVLVATIGIFVFVALPCSGIAWACASLERRRARALDPDAPAPAAAGRLLGIIGVALGVVALVLWSLVFASGGTPEEVLEGWRQELERRRLEQD